MLDLQSTLDPATVESEGLQGSAMSCNPGGDWHPVWGVGDHMYCMSYLWDLFFGLFSEVIFPENQRLFMFIHQIFAPATKSDARTHMKRPFPSAPGRQTHE